MATINGLMRPVCPAVVILQSTAQGRDLRILAKRGLVIVGEELFQQFISLRDGGKASCHNGKGKEGAPAYHSRHCTLMQAALINSAGSHPRSCANPEIRDTGS